MRGKWGLFITLHFMGGLLFGQSLTYNGLVQLIESQKLEHLEDLLPKLPEEMRSNYVLLYQSRSLQRASFENPRVVLFEKNAKLTCAFEGDGETLECFQFIDEERAFDFRQIQFPSPRNTLTQVAFSERNQTVDGKISCTQCHTADPRPNWDDYAHWPGAYAGEDDELSEEAKPYSDFVQKRTEHPRYRWLIQGPYPEDPYMNLNEGRYDVGHRPNLRFSEACGHLNALRTQRIMESKLTVGETLAFALQVLQCSLTPEQQKRITDLSTLFTKVGFDNRYWSTQILGDTPSNSSHEWEHQSGFGFLSLETAMAIVEKMALQNDPVLLEGVNKIRDYYNSRYSGIEQDFFHSMNDIVIDPDSFGGQLTTNESYVCPRLVEILDQRM